MTVSIAFFLLSVSGCNLGQQVTPSNTGDEKSQTASSNPAKQGEPAKSPPSSQPLVKPKELIALQQLTTKPKPGIVGIWLPQVRDPQTNNILPWEPGKDGKQQPWVIIEFKKDGTFTITGWGPRGKITSSGKYKLEGTKLTLIIEVIEGKPAPASERTPRVGKLNKDGLTLVDDAGVGWIKKK
ncbi:MAG TPA: hypothetical protein VNK96_02120 [Fimbriimonadales bacterium]|nr:hypothetical protein [Fimbriimonadales bacterium]